MRPKWVTPLIFIICIVSEYCTAMEATLDRLVPNQVAGWVAKKPDGVYDRKTLYDYIDGGAEVYLAYDFRMALARQYEREGFPTITADIFDMGSPSDAYGIFSFEREGPSVKVGEDSEYGGGLLRFWKGRYFVSLLASRETPESKRAVITLARIIASRITERGQRPRLVSMLPQEDLKENSIRYFHQKSGLDYHYYLADENILDLSEQTNAVLAQYGDGDRKHYLLIVQYPDARKASAAFLKFKSAYGPEGEDSEVLRSENLKWVASKCAREYIVAIFEAPSRARAVELLRSVSIPGEVKKG